jgi:hypothetical protein
MQYLNGLNDHIDEQYMHVESIMHVAGLPPLISVKTESCLPRGIVLSQAMQSPFNNKAIIVLYL